MEPSAAIAEQKAARSIGEKIAERIDAVGQRHLRSPPLEGRLSAETNDASSGPNPAPRRAEAMFAPRFVRRSHRRFNRAQRRALRFASRRAVD
jgi:hypothetical protein